MRSIKLPFSINNGRVATLSDAEQILKQKIVDALVTSPNERVMNPTYGAGAYSFLYEILDPLVFADFKVDALHEINKNVTGAQIVDLIINQGSAIAGTDDNTTVSITVHYRLPTNQLTSMTFSVSEFVNEESMI